MIKQLMAIFVFAFAFNSFGQSSISGGLNASYATNDIDLLSGSYIPLHNCEIFQYKEDYNTCNTIKQNYFGTTWELDGYAVNCNKLGNLRNNCRQLSNLIKTDSSTINCQRNSIGFGAEYDRCLIVKAAYQKGYFEQTRVVPCADCTTNNPIVIVQPEIISSNDSYRLCYANSYEQWQSEKKKKQDQGAGLAIAGTGIAIIGQIIAGNSNNESGRNIGNITTAVGATMAGIGLLEMISAEYSSPYQNVQCRQYYRTEVRPVIIKEQRCTTTRYYSSSWGRETEYFETKCSTRTYTSYERNSQFWN